MKSLESKTKVKESRPVADKIVLLLICSVIVLLPLYRGGYDALPTSVLLIISALMLVLISVTLNYEFKEPWIVFWMIITIAIFIKPIALFPAQLNGKSLQFGLGLDDLYTWAYFSSTWLIAMLIAQMREQHLKWMMLSVLISSLFQAVYGLYHFSDDSSYVLGMWEKQFYLESVTGTFVNRNIYAGMLALSWPLVLSALLFRKLPLCSKAPTSLLIVFSIVYSVIVLIALLGAQSRMGLVAALIALFVFVFTKGIKFKNKAYSAIFTQYSTLLLLVVIFLFLVWYGLGDIGQRYTELENGNSRTEIWQSIFSLPLELWIKGIGPGAFNDVFNQVRPAHFGKEMRYAHNDYLQFLLQFGLIWSSIIVGAFIWFLIKYLPEGDLRARSGALAALAALAIHSLVDCVMQIPGSGLVAWVAFGVLMNPDLTIFPDKQNTSRIRKSVSKQKSSFKSRRKTKNVLRKESAKNKRHKWLSYLRSD